MSDTLFKWKIFKIKYNINAFNLAVWSLKDAILLLYQLHQQTHLGESLAVAADLALAVFRASESGSLFYYEGLHER